MAPRSGIGNDAPTPTVEDYLHAIYSLLGEGETVFSARLARRMRVTPPTAWATVQRMVRDGLVTLDSKKVIHLTEKGKRLAEDIVRRHRLAERFLTDVLGLGWADCHEEAHLFEHALTPRLEERIVALLGNPTTCPHGSPIPGSGATLPSDLVPLASLGAGEEATIEFISEELEEDLDLLRYLERGRIMPGRRVRVVEVVSPSELMVVESDGQQVPLGLKVAQKIRVRR
ncbi:MAG TPA: metal-dependent transcriptional regulator [Dehalococcoidia bacterium]|nr:metal-dependent transcriptional regulator [Dehalococcoidia bacterium]